MVTPRPSGPDLVADMGAERERSTNDTGIPLVAPPSVTDRPLVTRRRLATDPSPEAEPTESGSDRVADLLVDADVGTSANPTRGLTGTTEESLVLAVIRGHGRIDRPRWSVDPVDEPAPREPAAPLPSKGPRASTVGAEER